MIMRRRICQFVCLCLVAAQACSDDPSSAQDGGGGPQIGGSDVLNSFDAGVLSISEDAALGSGNADARPDSVGQDAATNPPDASGMPQQDGAAETFDATPGQNTDGTAAPDSSLGPGQSRPCTASDQCPDQEECIFVGLQERGICLQRCTNRFGRCGPDDPLFGACIDYNSTQTGPINVCALICKFGDESYPCASETEHQCRQIGDNLGVCVAR